MSKPTTTTALHVIAAPYPGRGHINPMLTLVRLLSARLPPPAAITVVVTDEWLSLLSSAAAEQPGVRFLTLPNVIPSENVRAADLAGFIEAVYTKLEEPFERLLNELEKPATAIVADTYMPWVVDVGKRRGIPVCSLFTMSATFFSMLLYFDRLPAQADRHVPVGPAGESEIAEAGEELISKYIEGHKSLRLSDLDSFKSLQKPFKLALEAISQSAKAQCLIFTTAYELEPQIINSLRSQLPFPVFPIGPTIPYLSLQDINLQSPSHGDEDYLTFLNLQPQSSVLYVSLGSFLSVSRSQMDEIALGLQASNVRFLWVARGESTRLQEMVGGGGGSGGGMVVRWCDQLKVLCHPSVGGFLTHCGWNSTMEAVFAGVPMLTFPIMVDQPADGRLVVEEWGVGVELRGGLRSGEVIGREKIAELVSRVMDLEGEESREMRKRALMLREACRSAVQEGGSSSVNLSCLAEFLLQAKKTLRTTYE